MSLIRNRNSNVPATPLLNGEDVGDSRQQQFVKDHVAHYIPNDKYYVLGSNGWNMTESLTPNSVKSWLQDKGIHKEVITKSFGENVWIKAHKFEMAPSQPAYFVDADGETCLNLWRPYRWATTPGTYPNVERLLSWVCGQDQAAVAYVKNWMGFKLQNPGLRNGTGLLFIGAQGSGKSTIYKMMAQMLGPKNCTSIEGRLFGKGWGGKHTGQALLCCVEELDSVEASGKGLNNLFKQFLTDEVLTIELKGQNYFEIKNKASWIACSNHMDAMNLEDTDRRWTILENFDRTDVLLKAHGERHRDFMERIYHDGTFSPEFLVEVNAFMHDLLQMTVDRKAVGTPFESTARTEAIENSKDYATVFVEAISLTEDPVSFITDLLIAEDPRCTANHQKADKRASVLIAPTKNGPRNAIPQTTLAKAVKQYTKEFGGKNPPGPRMLARALKQAGWVQHRTSHMRYYTPPDSVLAAAERAATGRPVALVGGGAS